MFARRLFALLLAVVGILLSAPALADEGGTVPLPACIARAAPGVDLSLIVAGRVRFDCTTPQHRFGPGDFWAMSRVPDRLPPGRVSVRINSVWQDGLTLHVVQADGRVVTTRTTSATLPAHLQLGAVVEMPLPDAGARPRMIVWEVKGAANVRGVLLGQQLVGHRASHADNMRMTALYAAFGGLAFALLVYHLALWVVLRHRFQLAYCAMLAMLMVYAASSSAALAWAWPAIDNNDRLRINYLTLALAAAAAILFARTFFEEKVFAGVLARATRAAWIGCAANGLLFVPLSYWSIAVADRLYSCVFLATVAIVFPILWRAWRRRSNYLWLFACAWALPIAFAFARIANALHLLPASFWLDNSTVFSLGAEALLSSIAISYRIRLLTQERDEALANEVIARRLADIEPLTGLLNRRAFLHRAIGRPGRQQLHILDIDHFKNVNETLGHDGGDEVLRLVARALRRSAPESALVARIGGEEFAIVTAADAPLDAEAVLAALRATRMPFDLAVTASIGSCSGPLATDVDWKKLYQCADRALFAAKSSGRDRVRAA